MGIEPVDEIAAINSHKKAVDGFRIGKTRRQQRLECLFGNFRHGIGRCKQESTMRNGHFCPISNTPQRFGFLEISQNTQVFFRVKILVLWLLRVQTAALFPKPKLML